MSTPTTVESVLNRLADEAAATTPKPPVQPVEPEAPPVAEPAKEQPQPGTPPAEKPAEGPTVVEPEEEPDLEEPAVASGNFEEFKPVFDSHPELKTKLKHIIGREAAYSELGSFGEVKQIIERVPTLEDAETLTSQAKNHRNMSEAFRTSPADFADALKESDPLAFQQFMAGMPEVLRQEPDLWRRQAQQFTSEVLTNAYNIARSANDDELIKAIGLVYQSLGLSGMAPARPTTPESSELTRLRKEKREREQADTTAQFESFWNTADKVVINSSVAIIEDQLKKALPNATPKQMERMVNEAWDATLEMLGQQPQTMAQIDAFKRNAQKGRMGNAEHNQIVAYSLGRAKLVIPKTVRAVVNEWTKEVLRVNTETTEKKKAIAANTRDAGTGPQGTTSVSQPPNGKAGRRTEEDVYRELENRTYVPPSKRT